jgi:hypothetical protein
MAAPSFDPSCRSKKKCNEFLRPKQSLNPEPFVVNTNTPCSQTGESTWKRKIKEKVNERSPSSLRSSHPGRRRDGDGRPRKPQKFLREPTSHRKPRGDGARIYKQLLAGAGGRGWEPSGKLRVAALFAANDEGRGSPRAGAAATLLLFAVATEAAVPGGTDDAGAEVEAAEVGLEATRSQEGHMESVVAGRCM